MAISTGFKKLDVVLNGGFKDGCLYTLGGRPSMGKSAFALSVANYVCTSENKNVVFFSPALSRQALSECCCRTNSHAGECRIDDNIIWHG